MRFAPAYNLAFVHIPKNAGKSLRKALAASTELSYEPFARDVGLSAEEAETAFETEIVHPVLGKIKPTHLTLSLLSSHFPSSFSVLETARSFALTREPRARFISALMQRMKEFQAAGDIRADDPMLRREAHAVCEWLSQRATFHDPEYIHFVRQIDFTDLGDRRVVSAIFPVDRLDVVESWLKTQIGIPIKITHQHARREPKSWARYLVPAANSVARSLMPRAMRKVIRPIWNASGLFDTSAKRYQRLDLGSDVENFVAEYYAPDAALDAEAKTSAAQLGSVTSDST